jgi:hypothetical protein
MNFDTPLATVFHGVGQQVPAGGVGLRCLERRAKGRALLWRPIV